MCFKFAQQNWRSGIIHVPYYGTDQERLLLNKHMIYRNVIRYPLFFSLSLSHWCASNFLVKVHVLRREQLSNRFKLHALNLLC